MTYTLMLALSNYQIVGCIDPLSYSGHNSPYPHGWKELLDEGLKFDVIEVEMPEDMASAYLKHYRPTPLVRVVDEFYDHDTLIGVGRIIDETKARCTVRINDGREFTFHKKTNKIVGYNFPMNCLVMRRGS